MKTCNGATETLSGAIPHLRHPRGFSMPVKLDFHGARISGNQVFPPLRTIDGELVFALPGGGNFVQHN
jgi:hypothetical protein